MLDLIINSSLETIFPKNEIKKNITDLKKDFGYTLSQRFIIDNKNNLQSKMFSKKLKKLVFFQ